MRTVNDDSIVTLKESSDLQRQLRQPVDLTAAVEAFAISNILSHAAKSQDRRSPTPLRGRRSRPRQAAPSSRRRAGGEAEIPAGGINEKIRQLIRLSKEQGYLTFDDINEALPESVENQEEIDNVLSILQNLEIEILEPDQVEDYKQRQEEAEEEESRSSQNDILDDPVRMYLKQMGQVPLLTREQEVEISKRIENAELKAQEALFQASAVGGYIATLGAKLLNREERFDRDRHRQEDREPRRLLQGAAQARRVHPEGRGGRRRGVGTSMSKAKTRARAQEGPREVPQARNGAPGQLLEVLLQAEGLRGVPRAAAPRPRGNRGASTPSSSAPSTRRRRRTPRSTRAPSTHRLQADRSWSSASRPPQLLEVVAQTR